MSLPIESYFVRGPRLTHLVGASSGSADPSASSTGGSSVAALPTSTDISGTRSSCSSCTATTIIATIDATALSSRPFTASTVAPVSSASFSSTSAAAASTVTSDIVEHEEEAADDAAVLLPLPAQCHEVLGGGSLDGDDLLQRNARIDEVFGQPFRQAHKRIQQRTCSWRKSR
jgi:hypothetical protein